MTRISQLVETAIDRGYLSVEAETTLCQLFEDQCNLHDITALSMLQRAIASGQVKRRSQERAHAYAV